MIATVLKVAHGLEPLRFTSVSLTHWRVYSTTILVYPSYKWLARDKMEFSWKRRKRPLYSESTEVDQQLWRIELKLWIWLKHWDGGKSSLVHEKK